MKESDSPEGLSSSHLIDSRINELDDWWGQTPRRPRALVKPADLDHFEEWR